MTRIIFICISIFVLILESNAQVNSCIPDSPVSVKGNNPSTNDYIPVFDKYKIEYTQNQISQLKENIRKCNEIVDRELAEIENQQRELSSKMKDLIACKDIETLQKRIEKLQESRVEIIDETENGIRNIQYTGIYAVILDKIDIYSDKKILQDQSRLNLIPRAIEDLIGTRITRTTQVINLKEIKDVVRSFTSGSLRVTKIITDKSNYTTKRFYYVVMVGVTPQKPDKNQAGRGDFESGEALTVDILNDTDWKKQLQAKGMDNNDIMNIETEIQSQKDKVQSQNLSANKTMENIARDNEQRIRNIDKEIGDAEAKIKEKIQSLS